MSSDSRKFINIIAHAIRSADRSFFNEDYLKQARAVVKALNKEGFEIVPGEPSGELVEFLAANMPTGRMSRDDLMAEMYRLIVKNARRMR